VAALTVWRLYVRSAAVRQFLTAKGSTQMQLSIGTLLNRVCDATVELNHEGIITSPAPQLAALLLKSGRLAEQNIITSPFVDLVEASEQKRYADHLISMNEQLLRQEVDKGLPAAQLKLHLLDASHARVLVDVYHVCFLGIDDQPRHLLGIVEQIDDHRELSGRHDRYGVETQGHVETLDSSDEVSSSDNSSAGNVTSVPSESLKLSCWIRPESSDLTITKATVPFNMLWGTLSITCLRPQIYKKHRSKLSSALKRLLHNTYPGVAIRGIIFEPLAFRQQKIGISASLRIWRKSIDGTIQIDVVEHEWIQIRPTGERCEIFKLVDASTTNE